MIPMSITENVKSILSQVPEGVTVAAAAKTRRPEEIKEAIEAGIQIIGENYVQELEAAHTEIGRKAQWHFIGHLQKNKVKKAVMICDMIETVDSRELAEEIDKRCGQIGKIMPVLIEINSGREPQKAGVLPEDAFAVVKEIATLPNVKVAGLMTMGPLTGTSEEYRPYFKETRKIYEEIKKAGIPGVAMNYLSMGMTGSYKTALEEGANIIRIGTLIFGERLTEY